MNEPRILKMIYVSGFNTIRVTLDGEGGGTVESELKIDADKAGSVEDVRYNAAIDGLESLVLGHACAGIDVEDPKYVEGVRTALEAIENNA